MENVKLIVKEWMNSYKLFCREGLGLGSISEMGSQYHNMNEIHDEVCDMIQNSDKTSFLILMPRHSFKSWILTQGYSLWRLIKNPDERILIYSDSAEKAKGFLQGIKNHIEGKSPNSKFRNFFPNWETDPRKGKWNEGEIIIRPRVAFNVEPTIDIGGIESSKIGKHYDIIIFDDIVSDVNTTTKSQMDKVHDCYKKSLSLLRPGGIILIVGTRWHHADAYGRIIAENKEKDNFEIIIKDAEERNDKGKMIFEDIGLDKDFLAYQRKEQGSYIYSSLYRNNPCDDETALFKASDFSFYTPQVGFHKNFFITCCVDPAGEGEDFTGITVVGTDKNKRMYILDAFMAHLTPSQITNHVIRLNYKWGFDRFGIESNFFRGLFEKELKLAIEEESKNKTFRPFSVIELMASNANRTFSKILSLQPYHERKALKFPGEDLQTLPKVFSELAFQLMQFTIDGSKSPHDDLLKSLAWHTDLIVPGGESPEEEPPVTSAAWYERQLVETLARRKIPSRYKKPIELVFS